jgi:hypothetical protein
MSEVNRDIYPLGQSGLTGMLFCANKLNAYLNNEPWEQSIAIAQSMNPNAPFNSVDFLTVDYNGTSVLHEHTQREVQKIALTYIGTGASFGQNQYYNGSVDGIFIGATNELYYNYATLRKTLRSSFVQNCQARYKPNLYDLITGIKYSNILGVLCVGFNNGSEYCSLKYYYEHKDTELANKTPACIFMLGFFGNEDLSNVRRAIAPIDLTELHFQLWVLRSLNPVSIESTFVDFYNAFPPCVGASLNPVGVPNNHQLAVVLPAPSLIFPVVGCINGTLGKSQTWNTTPARNSSQSVIMYGGGFDTMYTVDLDTTDRIIRPVLTQQAFNSALSIAATYGIPFTTDFPTDVHSLFNTDGLVTYAPIANAGGYFDGRFETLTDSGELSQELSPENKALWNGDVNAPYNRRSYDPTIPIPAEEIDLTEPSFTPIGAFNKTYILNKDGVDGIQDFIYGADDSVIQNLLDGLKTFGTNPMNAFLSLHMYPFEVREFTGAAATARVVCGRVPISPQSGDVIGYLLPTDAKAVVDLGNFKIEQMFNCFLDFEPYTTIQLYIPFIGSVDLPPSLFMGKRVHVKIVCDWITAAATAIVYADGIPLIYQSGIIGVSIAMTGDNHAKTASDVLSGIVGAAGSAAQAVSGAMSLNPVQTATGAADTLKNLLSAQAAYTKTEFMQAGAASPMCALYLPNKCYITISRPRIGISEAERPQYNIINGFSMNRTATINSLISGGELAGGTGFIQAAPSVIPMKQYLGGITDGEYEELIQILAHGFRIDPL